MSQRLSMSRSQRCAARLLAAACGLALLAMPAVAQPSPPGQHPATPKLEPIQPPKDVPKPQRADRLRGLDFLFGALKVAPDDDIAKHIEARIWALWLTAGGDTANLLMGRVKTAMDAKQLDLALKLLDAVVAIKPDYVEAWNRRATIYYMKKDYVHSLEDLREVLALEPRHFGALAGLGMILQEFGDDKRALEAFRRAVAIHPHLQKIPELVKTLSEKVEGRDI
jgi:tetratricopeptide (TPR) repeat protein